VTPLACAQASHRSYFDRSSAVHLSMQQAAHAQAYVQNSMPTYSTNAPASAPLSQQASSAKQGDL